MNFKKFHVSRNLFDKSAAELTGYTLSGTTFTPTAGTCHIDYELPSGTYTISCDNDKTIFIRNGKVDSGYISQKTSEQASTTFTYDASVDGYLRISSFGATVSNIMLNTGSQPLPYEPYSSEVWHDTPHYIMGTDTDTITTLPADIYANDATATVGLKGDMSQSSTPTPQTPIQPQETGERTANLLDAETAYGAMYSSGVIMGQAGSINAINNKVTADMIGKTYTISITPLQIASRAFVSITINGTTYWRENELTVNQRSSFQFSPVTENDLWYITYDNGGICSYKDIMVNEGSTALPYEPYGYKIPILSGGVTTPVYLGEVQSTRKVKKLVLTGEESLVNSGGNAPYRLPINDIAITSSTSSIEWYCSHYQSVSTDDSCASYDYCISRTSTTAQSLQFRDVTKGDITAFKQYLAQQYDAGAPVTVWYVLATPTTGIVNEPIRKIGDYADEVSGITIPVTAGVNAIDVDTTLKPSEVTVNYKGWHPVVDVHVYPDSSWMPTSWEEFRKAVRSGKAQSLYPVGTKLYENWGDTTSDAWIVVDYPTGEDYLDSDLAQQGYTNRVMLMEEKLNYFRQFDAIEAWLYVETAIPAGTYRFTIPNYDASYGGNKTYIFTSTVNVPVGGQLTLTWAYNTNPTKVQGYSSSTSTSALFDVTIAEWDGTTACIDLGTIKLAQNDPDSAYGKLNHIHRARYASNNYYQSGYRQWLNTNASANWWTPTNIFDRPYGNRTNAGRLNVMNSNMKSVLATPTVNCITNNLFEYPSLDGTTFSLQTAYTVKDKLFPVTHSEINLSSSPNVNSVLDYYVGKGNAYRIKYRKDNGNAYYWWLRTPIPTFASVVRIVTTSGALSSYYAYTTTGSAAACIIQ